MESRVDALATSLSGACLECEALCCRTGRIALGPRDEPLFGRRMARGDGLVVVELQGGCEHLMDGRCAIYGSRPEVCRSFPLFLRYRTLFVAEACPAVRDGFLDEGLASLQGEFPDLRIIRQ